MRRFGLIGYPLSHSFSKQYFSEKFAKEKHKDCSYDNFPIASIAELQSLLQEKSITGLNVTIPYKKEVIPYLDVKNDVVNIIGACNCIRQVNGKLFGFNTDVLGFEQSLKKYLTPLHSKALILGTGGSSKAVAYVLNKSGISYLSVTRRNSDSSKNVIEYNQLTDEIILSHKLIINTTPLGMYPDTEKGPPINYDIITKDHYLFDLIYNPARTLFLSNGENKGATVQNGFEMLIIQAEESWKIWNSKM